MKFPKEIIMYIYSFDSKYHLKYKECIKELNMKIKQHNIFAKQIILITYNNVICSAKSIKLSTIF